LAGPLLEPLEPTDHLHLDLVTVPPPEPMCGPQQLGQPATSAVAGTPGHYAPANSFGPDDLTDATGLTASPATAWTAGQYVPLGDGSTMHWSSSAWVAGPA